VRAEVHAERSPGVEVIARGDAATGSLLLTHAPVLIERRIADDGRLVHALRAASHARWLTSVNQRNSCWRVMTTVPMTAASR
jgi:hypothetical protein